MHDGHGISRRHLGSMFLGAAGMSLLPAAAHAAKVKALCVTCIDYRFFNKDASYVANDLHLFMDADNVALAGASLSGVSKKFAQSVPAFWQQVDIAKSLHSIEKVVFIDHRECGAYIAEFGPPKDPVDETRQHVTVMTEVAKQFRDRRLALALDFYLMPVEGCAEHIAIPA